jgi:hypothetical protein
MDDDVRKYLASNGARGGAAGTGESKRRSPEHYRRLARLGVAARLANWARKQGGAQVAKSLEK